MSAAQDPHDHFIDFERDILGPNRTPPLVPLKPNLEPTESPPPLVPYDPSSESSDSEEEEQSRPPRRHRNRPDIANYAGKHAMESQSEGDDESGADDNDGRSDSDDNPVRIQTLVIHNPTPVLRMRAQPVSDAAFLASSIADDFPMIDSPRDTSHERHMLSPAVATPGIPTLLIRDHVLSNGAATESVTREWDVRPPPLELDALKLHAEVESIHDDSIVTSPALGKYTITRREADPDAIILPPLHRSPQRASPAGSPGSKQTLPSIRMTIPHVADPASSPFPGMSPLLLSRPSPGQLTETPTSYHQSPIPGMSPPGHHTLYNFRSSTRDSSISTSSEYTSNPSVAGSTPGSSITAQSPAASHHGSLSTLPEQEPLQIHESQYPSQGSGTVAFDSTETALVNGIFKCLFPGCSATSFQTQYLLNSHMNVHSNTRPHFCPVKGCLRGVGGQGFKRKNEMIRHGLVHTSPGYVCPFCADQQHRYPRPDNLQRHVRVHHVDRDRDDPLLRDVLNQRPEGGNRGRRRRINS